MVDTMDNEESLGLAFGRLTGEFLRTKVIPEMDAYAFAKVCAAAPVAQTVSADITPGTTDVLGALDLAEGTMNDNEVPAEGRLLFVSELAYRGLKANITRTVFNAEGNIERYVETFDGMRVIRVPQSRFKTAISLYDGSTSGEEAGGYVPASGAKNINFMIVHPSAVRTVIKYNPMNIISPEANQTHDGYLMKYRVYHDTCVLHNKVIDYLRRRLHRLSRNRNYGHKGQQCAHRQQKSQNALYVLFHYVASLFSFRKDNLGLYHYNNTILVKLLVSIFFYKICLFFFSLS